MKTVTLMVLAPLALALVFHSTASAAVKTETVEYKQGDTVLKGYIAYDDAIEGKRPGVLVIHEWWGLNNYPKMRARELAAMGYVALAADIYGDGRTATTRDDAAKLAGAFYKDRQLLRDRAKAGLDLLKAHKLVDPAKVAAIGFCFGGSTVLELARSGADLQAVVSFHGGLATTSPAQHGVVKAKVLVLTGGDDRSVPPKDVEAFQDEMRKAGVDWQLTSYGGAVHAFTNPAAGNDPSTNAAYNKDAARRSLRAMKAFFAETIGLPKPHEKIEW